MRHFFLKFCCITILAISCDEKHHNMDDPGWDPVDTTSNKNISVKIMTYNIRYGYPVGSTSPNLQATADVIREVGPDIALLQEVDNNTTRSGKVDQLSVLSGLTGMPYYYFGKAIDYQTGAFGVALLSKYKLENATTTILPLIAKQNESDYVEQRVLIDAEVSFKERIIIFATSHLDLTQYNRDVQVPAIHARLTSRAYPVIFGGDFNARPANSTIGDFVNRSYVFTSLTGYSISDYLIDYITYRPVDGFKLISHQVVTSASTVSDHYPVVSVLEIQ